MCKIGQKIKDLSITDNWSDTNKDYFDVAYEIMCEGESYPVILRAIAEEGLFLDDEKVDRASVISWLEENGYDEDKLMQMEEDFALEEMKSQLEYQVYRGDYELPKTDTVLIVERDLAYFIGRAKIENIYEYDEHFYSGGVLSLASRIFEGEPLWIYPDPVELLIYFYEKIGFEIEKIDADNGTLTIVMPEDDYSGGYCDVEMKTDIVEFFDKNSFDAMIKNGTYPTVTPGVLIEMVEKKYVFDKEQIYVKLGDEEVDAYELITLNAELKNAQAQEDIMNLRKLFWEYVEVNHGLNQYYTLWDYLDYEDIRDLLASMLEVIVSHYNHKEDIDENKVKQR